MAEIRCKTARYASMSSSDLQSYWGSHIIPAVVGPDTALFLTDHHHSALGLILADRSDPTDRLVIINITNNFASSSPLSDFWTKMLSLSLAWLYDDKNAEPMHPNLIPTDLRRLVNDPYRSLVWGVRNNGGYGAVDLPFQDFQYGQFLRAYNLLPLPSARASAALRGSNATVLKWEYCQAAPFDDEECFKSEAELLGQVLGKAIALCMSSAASGLPGWGQGVIDLPKCGNTSGTFNGW